METESVRQQKVARLLERDLGEIFREKGLDSISHGVRHMVSVTRVRMSPDLENAKVYLSVFPSAGAAEVLALVEERVGEVRYTLGKRVRSQLRVVPALRFFLDDSLDYIANIERLLGSAQGESLHSPSGEE